MCLYFNRQPQIHLTHEQLQILSHDIQLDHVVKIVAFAGALASLKPFYFLKNIIQLTLYRSFIFIAPQALEKAPHWYGTLSSGRISASYMWLSTSRLLRRQSAAFPETYHARPSTRWPLMTLERCEKLLIIEYYC